MAPKPPAQKSRTLNKQTRLDVRAYLSKEDPSENDVEKLVAHGERLLRVVTRMLASDTAPLTDAELAKLNVVLTRVVKIAALGDYIDKAEFWRSWLEESIAVQPQAQAQAKPAVSSKAPSDESADTRAQRIMEERQGSPRMRSGRIGSRLAPEAEVAAEAASVEVMLNRLEAKLRAISTALDTRWTEGAGPSDLIDGEVGLTDLEVNEINAQVQIVYNLAWLEELSRYFGLSPESITASTTSALTDLTRSVTTVGILSKLTRKPQQGSQAPATVMTRKIHAPNIKLDQ